ncbi:hypothetical protein F5050DRAFT_1109401 [Lentinula boryana]|uniref:Uncharacterized protein n=1 Tax=Lentinula boryana TaxID=40481 RepID=A0ABQ8QKD9_9AGAR|nr:hypothetical protein F5050DRAFT_1109401 [Lentinula boryana]
MGRHPLIHQHRRSDVFASPTVSGIAGALTVGTGPTTATALAEATNPASNVNPTVDGLATGTNLVSTPSSAPSSSTFVPTAAASSSSSSNGSSISMGTVIGACVGTLVGVLALVLLALWLYKRSDPAKQRRPSTRAGPGLQPNWNKLGDDDDKWEGMNQKAETVEIAPMEKLTMFKKATPSIRTAYTAKTEELPAFDFGSHPFSQYHPNLAKELASVDEPPLPPFTHRTDSAVVSWDGDTVGGASFLSARSNRVSGSMSPSLDIARPTPALTNSVPHRWESAEVIHIEGHVAEIIEPRDAENPFEHHSERRKSQHNPFFGSSSSSLPIAKIDKGKAREITPLPPIPISNPFADDSETMDNMDRTPTRPTFNHQVVGSISSVTSNDRAIQSLIAALDTTPEEVQARLKVAEPSLASDTADSIYTSAEYNSEDEDAEDVTKSFPLPPGSDHSV